MPDKAKGAVEKSAREGATQGVVGLSDLLAVPLSIDLQIAGSRLQVRDIVNLKVDQVFRLDRPASENLLLKIGSVVVAEGEAIATEKGTGVRITSLGRPR